jgi:hypothetical protein
MMSLSTLIGVGMLIDNTTNHQTEKLDGEEIDVVAVEQETARDVVCTSRLLGFLRSLNGAVTESK